MEPSRLDAEIQAHLDALVADYRRRGMSEQDAMLAARRDFGSATRVRERWRAERGWVWLGLVAGDIRSGLRHLAKYPGLAIAGGLALALAIGVGAAWYDLSGELFRPTLPLPEGNRIVEIRTVDESTSRDESRMLSDLVTWRRDAGALSDLGAARTLDKSLLVDGAPPESVRVAAVTASAFRLVRLAPILGRPLLDADEEPDAAPVAVLGHDVWQRVFGGRTDVIGRQLELGGEVMTVVGVMPEGFAFPFNHRLWVPLRRPVSRYAARQGPGVLVFARLASDSSLTMANAEMDVLSRRQAVASPVTHEHLRSRVVAFGSRLSGGGVLSGVATHLPVLLVLIVACVNVATLVYARTATRESEIATRHAIGASRAHIVGQFFVEALVFACLASVVGLVAAHVGLKSVLAALFPLDSGGPPFWSSGGLRLTTVPYAMGLAVVCAGIFGVLPAIKATSGFVSQTLKHAGAGGSTLRFGAVWTAAMIAQVAVTVVCIAPAIGGTREAVRDRIIREQFPAESFLAVRLDVDRDAVSGGETPEALAARAGRVYLRVEQAVAEASGVSSVTFADGLPGMDPQLIQGAEVEPARGAPPTIVSTLWTSKIGPRFFDTFERRLVAGRDFHEGDRTPDARTAIVNEAFARQIAGGVSPVGMRVRHATDEQTQPGPWVEIVGVVQDVGMTPTRLGEAPYLYYPVSSAMLPSLTMGIRMTGGMSDLMIRVPALVARIDPSLRVTEVRPLDEMSRRETAAALVIAIALVVVVSLGLLLSAGGIFALTSVNVSRRTREIGLRTALGANRHRLLAAILSRVVLLVAGGIAAGSLVLGPLLLSDPVSTRADLVVGLCQSAGVMLIVGVLACIGPARRALRIAPAQALRTT